jgi:hypothetical protein
MFDAEKPMTVMRNGKPAFSGLVARDPRAMLESIMENVDPEQVFTCRIDP